MVLACLTGAGSMVGVPPSTTTRKPNFLASADIAVFPWLRSWKNQGIDWNDYPHLRGWFDEIGARPAVQRGVEVLADRRKPLVGDRQREILFGAEQYRRH